MSSVAVTDKRGGVFQVVVTFTYGECDRLPYNALRKVKARIEQVSHGGIKATAEFNIRNPKDSENFVEVLDNFGMDGSFVHGSPADPEKLNLEEPPEDDDSSGIRSATMGSAAAAVSDSAPSASSPEAVHPDMVPDVKSEKTKTPAKSKKGDPDPVPEEEEDLETEEEADLEIEEEADLEVEEKDRG